MDPMAPLWAKLEEEWLAMRFVCALVKERGVQPKTAASYFSAVQGWHAREFGVKLAGGLQLQRLPQMLKGMRREIPEKEKKLRRGISAANLRKGMNEVLDPANPLHANVRAAMATAFQGLLRCQEFAVNDSNKARSAESVPLREDLVHFTKERMVIMIQPCKNMRHLNGKTSPLTIGAGGEMVDAVAEMRNVFEVDPTPKERAAETPLFRNPATNKPFTYDEIMKWTRLVVAAAGENPDDYGTHSFRIGGATALFAKDANETVIRTMGRWSSDMHRLYTRACFEHVCEWTKRAGSADVTTLEGFEFTEVDDY